MGPMQGKLLLAPVCVLQLSTLPDRHDAFWKMVGKELHAAIGK